MRMRVEEVEESVDLRFELVVHLIAVLGGCANREVHFLPDEAESTPITKYSTKIQKHAYAVHSRHARTRRNTHVYE